jgi:hypothetical protein
MVLHRVHGDAQTIGDIRFDRPISSIRSIWPPARSAPIPLRPAVDPRQRDSLRSNIADTRGEHSDSPLATRPISAMRSSIDSLRRW